MSRQTPLSMRFSRQEFWSGLPFPPVGDLPDWGIQLTSPVSPALQADSLPTEPTRKINISIYLSVFISIYLDMGVQLPSHVWPLVSPWTVACQAPLSMKFSRQEYWSRGLPFPTPGILPNPRIQLVFLISPPLAGGFFTLEKRMVTHSRILAWRIPWTEKPGGLQSTGLQRVGQLNIFLHHVTNKYLFFVHLNSGPRVTHKIPQF